MDELFHNLFNGPVGIIIVLVILYLFFSSFGWKKEQPPDPDAALGKAARSFFGKLLKKDD